MLKIIKNNNAFFLQEPKGTSELVSFRQASVMSKLFKNGILFPGRLEQEQID